MSMYVQRDALNFKIKIFVDIMIITTFSSLFIISIILAENFLENVSIPVSNTLMILTATEVLTSATLFYIFIRYNSGIFQVVFHIQNEMILDERLYRKAYVRLFRTLRYIPAVSFIVFFIFQFFPILFIEINKIYNSGLILTNLSIYLFAGFLIKESLILLRTNRWSEKIFGYIYDYIDRVPIRQPLPSKIFPVFHRLLFTVLPVVLAMLLVAEVNTVNIIEKFTRGEVSRHLVQSTITMIFSFSLIVFALIQFGKSLNETIKNLLLKTSAISAHDYDVTIMNYHSDEFSFLYRDFENLRKILKKNIEELETKVEERTGALNSLVTSLSRYLSPQLIEKLKRNSVSENGIRSERKKLTIFFSDIVSFTQISENLSPEDLTHVLNTYLSDMADIAIRWEGTIDKYIGDAIMIFFGDPEYRSDQIHARNALRMSIDMLNHLKELNQEFSSRGLPELHIRVGIATGYCTVGNFGSENRYDYTVIGTPVNLASRLQNAAPVDSVFVSEATYLLAKNDIHLKKAGIFELKGIHEKQTVYQLMDDSDDHNGKSELNVEEVCSLLQHMDLNQINDMQKRQIKKDLARLYRLLDRA